MVSNLNASVDDVEDEDTKRADHKNTALREIRNVLSKNENRTLQHLLPALKRKWNEYASPTTHNNANGSTGILAQESVKRRQQKRKVRIQRVRMGICIFVRE